MRQAHCGLTESSAAPNSWMTTAWVVFEVRDANSFGKTGDVAVMIIFIGLTWASFVGIPILLAGRNGGGPQLVALLQCLTGIWLIYCAWAPSVMLAHSYKRSI
jgi:hypothetical protein